MSRLNSVSPSRFLKLLFFFLTLTMFGAAVIAPDRVYMFSGLKNIILMPAKTPTNYVAPGYGGYAGTFLNGGLVCLFCTLLYCLPKAKANSVSVVAFLLTLGFTFWGVNVLNMWFGFFGVALYCLVKKESLGSQVNAMLFTTGLAPLFSDLLLYYPNDMYIGLRWQGFALALFIGLILGFFLPAGLAYASNVHKGFSIYSAALPMGISAFFLRAGLYGILGAPRGTTAVGPIVTEFTGLGYASWNVANCFCIGIFLLCIIAAFIMGCKPKDYWNLMKDSGHGVDFSEKYGPAATLMNVGIFGLFIVGYYNLAAYIGGNDYAFNGVTLGCIFCMLSTCCSGSHPRNVWPILVGYIAASFGCQYLFENVLNVENVVFTSTISAQAILVGACFANGLSPISGKYGWPVGILAGMIHYVLVASIPLLHGGFLLYNGGLTACLVCLLLLPVLQKFLRTKEERKALKAVKLEIVTEASEEEAPTDELPAEEAPVAATQE